jgi:hypothetical protein
VCLLECLLGLGVERGYFVERHRVASSWMSSSISVLNTEFRIGIARLSDRRVMDVVWWMLCGGCCVVDVVWLMLFGSLRADI